MGESFTDRHTKLIADMMLRMCIVFRVIIPTWKLTMTSDMKNHCCDSTIEAKTNHPYTKSTPINQNRQPHVH